VAAWALNGLPRKLIRLAICCCRDGLLLWVGVQPCLPDQDTALLIPRAVEPGWADGRLEASLNRTKVGGHSTELAGARGRTHTRPRQWVCSIQEEAVVTRTATYRLTTQAFQRDGAECRIPRSIPLQIPGATGRSCFLNAVQPLLPLLKTLERFVVKSRRSTPKRSIRHQQRFTVGILWVLVGSRHELRRDRFLALPTLLAAVAAGAGRWSCNRTLRINVSQIAYLRSCWTRLR
jgi:hypothetical protein